MTARVSETRMTLMTRMMLRRGTPLALCAMIAGCEPSGTIEPPAQTPDASLDAQVRQSINGWGVVPILPVNTQSPALVDLGRSLFFDKILSGNRDVACASCHSPLAHSGDDQSLAIGTGAAIVGGTRALGAGRQFTPRNAPSLFNVGLGTFYIFWDGRLSGDFGSNQFRAPSDIVLPTGLSGVLAAQALIPLTNRVEMRGDAGDRDVFGNPNELAAIPDGQNAAIWDAAMRRVLAVAAYQQKFNAAFPGVSTSQLSAQHAANAIAAFETQTFTKSNSAFDRYLARDDNALSVEAKRGALLFFGKARCSQCHNGALLGSQQFASVGVPQLGPGTGSAAPLDGGREDQFTGAPKAVAPQFLFRVPPLRNVELTAPYMHDGAYATLEAVIRHYNNVDSALKAFDPSELAPSLRASYHGDAATLTKILTVLDGRLRQPMGLTTDEQSQLVAFLKSLTDPSARDLSGVTPTSVPSGLPIKN
jgi:cytochrome c peroxidase